jgi:hypothetical protein
MFRILISVRALSVIWLLRLFRNNKIFNGNNSALMQLSSDASVCSVRLERYFVQYRWQRDF